MAGGTKFPLAVNQPRTATSTGDNQMTYQPKPPRRVTLAAKVEPRIKEWLQKQFPKSVSHGVNYILEEYMAKHTKDQRR